jgi:hypothetical protein
LDGREDHGVAWARPIAQMGDHLIASAFEPGHVELELLKPPIGADRSTRFGQHVPRHLEIPGMDFDAGSSEPGLDCERLGSHKPLRARALNRDYP